MHACVVNIRACPACACCCCCTLARTCRFRFTAGPQEVLFASAEALGFAASGLLGLSPPPAACRWLPRSASASSPRRDRNLAAGEISRHLGSLNFKTGLANDDDRLGTLPSRPKCASRRDETEASLGLRKRKQAARVMGGRCSIEPPMHGTQAELEPSCAERGSEQPTPKWQWNRSVGKSVCGDARCLAHSHSRCISAQRSAVLARGRAGFGFGWQRTRPVGECGAGLLTCRNEIRPSCSDDIIQRSTPSVVASRRGPLFWVCYAGAARSDSIRRHQLSLSLSSSVCRAASRCRASRWPLRGNKGRKGVASGKGERDNSGPSTNEIKNATKNPPHGASWRRPASVT